MTSRFRGIRPIPSLGRPLVYARARLRGRCPNSYLGRKV